MAPRKEATGRRTRRKRETTKPKKVVIRKRRRSPSADQVTPPSPPPAPSNPEERPQSPSNGQPSKRSKVDYDDNNFRSTLPSALSKINRKELRYKVALQAARKWSNELEFRWKKMEGAQLKYFPKFDEKAKWITCLPEDHEKYNTEWIEWYSKRYQEVIEELLDPDNYNYIPDWRKAWAKRWPQLLAEEYDNKMKEIKSKYGFEKETLKKLFKKQNGEVATLPATTIFIKQEPLPPIMIPPQILSPPKMESTLVSACVSTTPHLVPLLFNDSPLPTVSSPNSLTSKPTVSSEDEKVFPSEPNPSRQLVSTPVIVPSSQTDLTPVSKPSDNIESSIQNVALPQNLLAHEMKLMPFSVALEYAPINPGLLDATGNAMPTEGSSMEKPFASGSAVAEAIPQPSSAAVSGEQKLSERPEVELDFYMPIPHLLMLINENLKQQLGVLQPKVESYLKQAEKMELKKCNAARYLLGDEQFVALLYQINGLFMSMIRANTLPLSILRNLNMAVYSIEHMINSPDFITYCSQMASAAVANPVDYNMEEPEATWDDDAVENPSVPGDENVSSTAGTSSLPLKKEISRLLAIQLYCNDKQEMSDEQLNHFVRRIAPKLMNSEPLTTRSSQGNTT